MMSLTTANRDDEAAAIWTPVVGMTTGESVTLAGGLTYRAATKAADQAADRLQAQGQPVAWSGARRHV